MRIPRMWIPKSRQSRRIVASTLSLVVLSAGLLGSRPARADFSASVLSGFSLINTAGQTTLAAFSPLLGIEALYSVGFVQIGGFYSNNFLEYSNGQAGSLRFFGPMIRIGMGMIIPGTFFDSRVGLSSQTVNSASSDAVWAIGIGGGYRFNITPSLSLSPRIGLNTEPYQTTTLGTTTSYAQTIWDFGMLVTYSF